MKKITSILLACLLLMSSIGMTYAQHFCGEYMMLSKITLGETSLSCGMAMEPDHCDEDFNTIEEEEDHNCCDTTYTKVDTDDSFSPSDFSFEIPFLLIAPAAITFSIENSVAVSTNIKDFSKYDPPPLLRDIQVLYETFLI